MEDYIKGNKEAWEEAFELRDQSYGRDIAERIQKEDYAYFNEDMRNVLKKYDLAGKTIGQFCCNNGRELLSLVKTTQAKEGIGFDIADNMVAYANEKAIQLSIPCSFVATNILEIDDKYNDRFDVMILTIGALCWFKSLHEYFMVVSRCLKKGGIIIINEQHPFTNMLAQPDDDEYISEYPANSVFSYFSHEWVGNGGMGYMVGKQYESKTFTDYTHPLSEILGEMCQNGIVITDFHEFPYDISGGFESMTQKEFPLSMIIEGKKL